MSLDLVTLSSNVKNIYTDECNLNPDQTFLRDSNTGSVVLAYYPNNMSSRIAIAYDNYAKQGIVKSTINQGSDYSLIENGIYGLDYTDSGVYRLAQAYANYYAGLCLIPGDPTHGGVSVVNITNNASSLVGTFEADIRNTFTHIRQNSPFERFFGGVEEAAKTITWYITEQFSDGSTQTFPENIS